MGKSYGVLGKHNGKVGEVTFRRFRNELVISEYNPYGGSRVPATEAQLEQRAKFRALMKLTPSFAGAAALGLDRMAKGTQWDTRNMFSKLNWGLVSIGVGGEAEVDLTKVRVSDGQLPPVSFRTPSYEGDLEVSVAYGADGDVPQTDGNDEVYLLVYQADLNQSVLSAASKRSTGTVAVKVPGAWGGMKVHVYGFAIGGGRKNSHLRSMTQYLGEGNVE